MSGLEPAYGKVPLNVVVMQQDYVRLNQLKRGDRVVTAGGIVGTVKKATEGSTELDVEIAPNVTVSVVRSTITSVVTPVPANDKV